MIEDKAVWLIQTCMFQESFTTAKWANFKNDNKKTSLVVVIATDGGCVLVNKSGSSTNKLLLDALDDPGNIPEPSAARGSLPVGVTGVRAGRCKWSAENTGTAPAGIYK